MAAMRNFKVICNKFNAHGNSAYERSFFTKKKKTPPETGTSMQQESKLTIPPSGYTFS
jgi:hypothetical protein